MSVSRQFHFPTSIPPPKKYKFTPIHRKAYTLQKYYKIVFFLGFNIFFTLIFKNESKKYDYEVLVQNLKKIVILVTFFILYEYEWS